MRLHSEPSPALAQMLAKDQENGIDVFDDGPVPRPTPGPPVHLEPLRRPVFDPPDWRAEEARAIARDTAPAADPGPPPPASLDSRPAKPRKESKKPVATPNLDAWRALQEDRR